MWGRQAVLTSDTAEKARRGQRGQLSRGRGRGAQLSHSQLLMGMKRGAVGEAEQTLLREVWQPEEMGHAVPGGGRRASLCSIHFPSCPFYFHYFFFKKLD